MFPLEVSIWESYTWNLIHFELDFRMMRDKVLFRKEHFASQCLTSLYWWYCPFPVFVCLFVLCAIVESERVIDMQIFFQASLLFHGSPFVSMPIPCFLSYSTCVVSWPEQHVFTKLSGWQWMDCGLGYSFLLLLQRTPYQMPILGYLSELPRPQKKEAPWTAHMPYPLLCRCEVS